MGESLETSEGDASSKETHFIAVWVRLEKGLASSRPSWSSSVEKLGCRDTDPPAPSLTSYNSVWTHPCLSQPSTRSVRTPYIPQTWHHSAFPHLWCLLLLSRWLVVII